MIMIELTCVRCVRSPHPLSAKLIANWTAQWCLRGSSCSRLWRCCTQYTIGTAGTMGYSYSLCYRICTRDKIAVRSPAANFYEPRYHWYPSIALHNSELTLPIMALVQLAYQSCVGCLCTEDGHVATWRHGSTSQLSMLACRYC